MNKVLQKPQISKWIRELHLQITEQYITKPWISE